MNAITLFLSIFLFTSVYGLDSSGGRLNSFSNMGPGSAAVKKLDLRPNEVRSRSCFTSTGEVGECVSYYNCNDAPQDIYDKGSTTGCPHYLHVCCIDVPTGDEDLEI
ncbi:uncharacterized protein LOC123718079 [Pieris brassicae]|nr:uncharacterized protein LOC123718079 [Pieris brassicae]